MTPNKVNLMLLNYFKIILNPAFLSIAEILLTVHNSGIHRSLGENNLYSDFI